MLRFRCQIQTKHKGEILMSIVKDTSFSFNKQFRFNFDGGELFMERASAKTGAMKNDDRYS